MTNFKSHLRKMKITLIVSTLLACFVAQGRSQQTNLIKDNGFEASSSLAPYWNIGGGPTSVGVDTVKARAHSGNNSGYLYDDGGAGRFIDLTQTVTVAANTTYTLTGWVHAGNTTGGLFGVRTPSGANLRTVALVNTNPDPSTSVGADYLQYTVTFDSGIDTSVVIFAGYATPGSASFIELDDVSLVGPQSSAPAPPAPPTPPAPPAGSSQAVIDYPSGFASSSGKIWLENFAKLSGSSIHLVPSTVHNGSNAWFEIPENEQAFTTTFTFHIVCTTNPSNCGGGFGFMMICACEGGNPTYNPATGHPGYTYSGFSGAQFSWSQCEVPLTPSSEYCLNNGTNGNTGSTLTHLPDNIIVTFNNYNNNGSGSPGASLTQYVTNGTFPAGPVTAENDMAPSGINLNSGHEFSATLAYDGSTLTENLTDTVTNAHYTHTYTGVNIPAAITGNTAFIGFGGGTGAAVDDVYLDSWTYTVE
jgi:hypothetical protein